jgi:hypothetical protein
VVNDPLTGQGAGLGSRCAFAPAELIVARPQFDEKLADRAADRLWEIAEPVVAWSHHDDAVLGADPGRLPHRRIRIRDEPGRARQPVRIRGAAVADAQHRVVEPVGDAGGGFGRQGVPVPAQIGDRFAYEGESLPRAAGSPSALRAGCSGWSPYTARGAKGMPDQGSA